MMESFNKSNLNIRADESDKKLMNGTTYFDEDESREGGSLMDESTGKRYNNSGDMDDEYAEKSMVHETTFSNVGFTEKDIDANKLLLEKYKDNPEILRELGLDSEKAA